jgi:hypothetical protein
VEEARGKIADALLQRLIMKPQKIAQLAQGIRAIAAEDEPIRRVLSRIEVADGAPPGTAFFVATCGEPCLLVAGQAAAREWRLQQNGDRHTSERCSCSPRPT